MINGGRQFLLVDWDGAAPVRQGQAYTKDLADSVLVQDMSGFPTVAIIDAFTTPASGPMGANWGSDPLNESTGVLEHYATQCTISAGTVGSGYWSAEQFGPDCEVYLTLATYLGGTGEDVDTLSLLVRLQDPATVDVDGYEIKFRGGSSNMDVNATRISTGIELGAEGSVPSLSTNDKLGVRIVGDVIIAYHWSTANSMWSVVGLWSDSNVPDAGYVGLELVTADNPHDVRVDDFGAGNVSQASCAVGRGLADSAVATESLAALAVAKALTDGAAGSEVLAFAVAKALADGATGSEVLSRVATFVRSFDDGASVGDAATRAVAKALADGAASSEVLAFAVAKALADGATGSEVLSRVVTFVRSFDDGANVGDALTRAMAWLLGDGVAGSEVLAFAVAKVLADGATGSDMLSRVATFVQSFGDSAVATEVLGRTGTFGREFGDGASVGDAVTRGVGKAAADGVTTAESLDWALGLALLDSAVATEALVLAVAKALADSAVVTDALTERELGRSLADGFTIGDGLAPFAVAKALADSTVATEMLSRVVAFVRTLTESPIATEATAKALTLAAWADGVDVADATAWLFFLAPITEIITATDSTVPATTITKTFSESLVASEVLAKALALAAFSDAVVVADLFIIGKGLILSDGVAASETFSRVATFARTITESPVASEALARALEAGLADGVTVAEALAQGWARALADGVVAGDAVAKTPGKAAADGVVAGDDVLAKAIAARLQAAILAGEERPAFDIGTMLSDQANAGEALARAIVFVREFSDAAAAGDALTKAVALAAWADAVNAGEAVALGANKALADQVSAGEALTQVIEVLIAEGVLAREWISGLPNMLLTLADRVLASDAAASSVGKALADQVEVALGLPAVVALPGVWLALWGDAEGQATGQILRLVVGDTLPFLIFKLTDAESGPYDLDGATVTLQMWDREETVTVEVVCTMVDAQDGLVKYELTTADTAAGEYRAHLVIEVGGREFVSESFVVRVRERL